MNIRDRTNWIKHLKVREEKLMRRIVYFLSSCVDYSKNPSEEHISRNLVNRINQDSVFRSLFYIAQEEAIEKKLVDGEYIDIGKIDIKITINSYLNTYIAIEAKKLNVNGAADVKSYIVDGLLRFVTAQYAEKMPIGCLLGYVMGVNLACKSDQLKDLISSKAELEKLKRKQKVSKRRKKISKYLVNGLYSSDVENLDEIGNAVRFETKHNRLRGRGEIIVVHTLVSVS